MGVMAAYAIETRAVSWINDFLTEGMANAVLPGMAAFTELQYIGL
jgi:hypothetical protein